MPPTHRARVLMIQGTSSSAGKSTLTAAFCRIYARRGLRVAPFKAQNMSLNAAVTPDGSEIGRAQMLQAQAARAVPRAEMNPILLKPQADAVSQVVVLGKTVATRSAREYYTTTPSLWPVVVESLETLRRDYDLVVIEGAGSAAEINLRDRDLVNMRVAIHADAPVILVGDIERGGIFAQLIGTVSLLEPEERRLVKGMVVNKFRGDRTLFDPGPALLTQHTGIPTLGVLPYFHDIHLPEEDSPRAPSFTAPGDIIVDVAVIAYPHMANFDDLDPVRRMAGVRVRYVRHAGELGTPDLIILPGSKTTLDDLRWLRAQALDRTVLAHRSAGRPVIGLCGGYQMLGRVIRDPDGLDGTPGEAKGLGLLPVDTDFTGEKATRQVKGRVESVAGILARCKDASLTGYEIHRGRTTSATNAPFTVTERSGAIACEPDGAIDADGLTIGTYFHGFFDSAALRRGIFETLAARAGRSLPDQPDTWDLDHELDRLADGVESNLNMTAIDEMIGLPSRSGWEMDSGPPLPKGSGDRGEDRR